MVKIIVYIRSVLKRHDSSKGGWNDMNVRITPKGLRVSANKTQQEVANYLGLSLTQYKRKENNEARWYADEIYKLSKFYNVPISIFFTPEVSQKDTIQN